MKTLFWALFGLSDLEVLQIPKGNLKLTESLGHFIYSLYLLVAVIVLLNALIAMMSSTYAKVQENAEKEWKYCRSTMMTEYILDGAVLPPPFNLIPDVWLCLSYFIPKKQQNKPCTENCVLKNHDNHYEETNNAVKNRYIYELQRTVRKMFNQRCMKCSRSGDF
ncbi:short transient receptor potential channel 3-like [Amphiura filiformis]|uniref:short transient receptor potential channel 3-like n=1 Tax=Amphiura filiformis TaxID=82378 RepID=UPI003B21E9C3